MRLRRSPRTHKKLTRTLLCLPLTLPLAGFVFGAACDTSAPATPYGPDTGKPVDASFADAVVSDVLIPRDAPPVGAFCSLPGSFVTTATGVVSVVQPYAASLPDLSWMGLPPGFCVHFYGNVPNARQVKVAPGGEIFVASPTAGTTGGGPGGLSAIVVLPDDNHDGFSDGTLHFMDSLPSTQGMLFNPHDGYFYYQNGTAIKKVAYNKGDRTPSGASETVANITLYTSGLHWPKPIDVSDDGTIYVGNGGDQGESCDVARPFHGGILKLDGPSGGTPVARGLRNPIALKCAPGTNTCFGVELARDYSTSMGGREKLFPIRQGDDWGFNCCATQNLPYSDVMPAPDCSQIAPESDSFIIGQTPFGLDFEQGQWPAPWKARVYVTNHGVAGSWAGARVVGVQTDPTTGWPVFSPAVDGGDGPAGTDFATGWDNGQRAHGRPAAVAFAPDGRLFLTNDNNGDVVWIAPVSMPAQDH